MPRYAQNVTIPPFPKPDGSVMTRFTVCIDRAPSDRIGLTEGVLDELERQVLEAYLKRAYGSRVTVMLQNGKEGC